jgi:hypothetical protein
MGITSKGGGVGGCTPGQALGQRVAGFGAGGRRDDGLGDDEGGRGGCLQAGGHHLRAGLQVGAQGGRFRHDVHHFGLKTSPIARIFCLRSANMAMVVEKGRDSQVFCDDNRLFEPVCTGVVPFVLDLFSSCSSCSPVLGGYGIIFSWKKARNVLPIA